MAVSRGFLTRAEIDAAREEIQAEIAHQQGGHDIIAELGYDDEAILDMARSKAPGSTPRIRRLMCAWIGLVDLGVWQDEHIAEMEARR